MRREEKRRGGLKPNDKREYDTIANKRIKSLLLAQWIDKVCVDDMRPRNDANENEEREREAEERGPKG